MYRRRVLSLRKTAVRDNMFDDIVADGLRGKRAIIVYAITRRGPNDRYRDEYSVTGYRNVVAYSTHAIVSSSNNNNIVFE